MFKLSASNIISSMYWYCTNRSISEAVRKNNYEKTRIGKAVRKTGDKCIYRLKKIIHAEYFYFA